MPSQRIRNVQKKKLNKIDPRSPKQLRPAVSLSQFSAWVCPPISELSQLHPKPSTSSSWVLPLETRLHPQPARAS